MTNEKAADEPFSRAGMTLSGGRIVVGHHLRGMLWAGRRIEPRERQVLVVFKPFPYATYKERTDELFGYEVPGIAPLAFLGYPDQDANPAADELRGLDTRGVWPKAVLAEYRPEGRACNTEPLTEIEAVRLGIALCDTILAY
jgi:hypothetical protein